VHRETYKKCVAPIVVVAIECARTSTLLPPSLVYTYSFDQIHHPSPSAQDWHPLLGGLGSFTRFWGARCLHWTSENTDLDTTRVRLN